VQRPLTSEPKGWPAGPTLQPLAGSLHGDTLQEVVEGNPKLKAGHHLVCYRLNQVGNPFLDPYKYPPTGGN
jgi:hypothetical protein